MPVLIGRLRHLVHAWYPMHAWYSDVPSDSFLQAMFAIEWGSYIAGLDFLDGVYADSVRAPKTNGENKKM